MLWSFRYYLAGGRFGGIRDAHDTGTRKRQAQFRSKLGILAQLEPGEWREPLCKKLNGECDGLVEIRFKSDGVQQRPLGFVSGPYEFTLLFWATEKNNRFVPKSACATALVWMQAAIDDREATDDLWIALE